MKYFPMFFDLSGQSALVVGGGEVALRKVELLLRAGAAVNLVAPEVHPDILALAGSEKIRLSLREFVPEDLQATRVAIVATRIGPSTAGLPSSPIRAALRSMWSMTARRRASSCRP